MGVVMSPCLIAVARAVCNNLELPQVRGMKKGEDGKENEGDRVCYRECYRLCYTNIREGKYRGGCIERVAPVGISDTNT